MHLLPGTNTFANASAIIAEIFEGIEDLEILTTTELNSSEVYVVCKYNLRRVPVTISIPINDYNQNLAYIEGGSWFYDTEFVGNTVMLSTIIRPYFTASFIFNRQSEACNGFLFQRFAYANVFAIKGITFGAVRTNLLFQWIKKHAGR
jgi:hypothetical protein